MMAVAGCSWRSIVGGPDDSQGMLAQNRWAGAFREGDRRPIPSVDGQIESDTEVSMAGTEIRLPNCFAIETGQVSLCRWLFIRKIVT
ncbi:MULTISPECIES: hypothetical protein [unclassified Burkholderia]|uniref:hypothetical protein n=1 Tax=unclassified Burkholderia TaxID=2613784 RepID=UPI000A95C353|nr:MULTISPECIES: hypothetical protein [unclassified Burkholderia]